MAVEFSTSGLILFIFTIFFNVVCGIFILLRILAIRVSRREFYIDDGFIVFAYANVVALGGVAIWSCVNGLGKSAAVLTEYEIGAAAKVRDASDSVS
ncbi:hypothetical protein N0V93_008211 [Gnomoniopsis smithogilvyi]|uniref:Uncharacterized protein n=1 Tax=Gnomoniopsis smithogilvyi TaxID=1191159 RepID=A0A9W9CTH4_9PEZI|nr:hypothetical protein N0V93_008211 [Gnomoniopsis smithogilvyi]